jgi:hypothetical protein
MNLRIVSLLTGLLFVAASVNAAPAPVEPLKSSDLSAFRASGKWVIVGDAAKDPNND